MEILQSFKVDKLFDTIMIESSYSSNYSTIHHLDCGHTFGGQWQRKYHSYYGYVTGAKHYTCPNCGKHSDPYKNKILLHFATDTIFPTDLQIDVIECKNHIDLRVRYNGIALEYDGMLYERGRFEERLRFDFKRKMAIFIDSEKNRHDVTVNYIRDRADKIFSIFNFLNGAHAVYGSYRKDLLGLYKTLRNAFERRVHKAYGFKCKDVYVVPSNSEDGGFHKTMLLNMCLKIAAPDMPNITTLLGERFSIKSIFFNENVLDDTRKGMNFTEALLKHFNAPNSRALRQKMVKDPGAVCVSETLRMFKDENNIRKILNCLERSLFTFHNIVSRHEAKKAVKDLIKMHGETVVVNFIQRGDISEINDALRMYGSLKPSYRKQIMAKRVRLRDFHDTVMEIYNKQEYGDIVLPKLPALGSDVNGMHFMVPQTAADLMTVGKELKNCVGSYRDKVIKGECAIVVVTDDHMKPVACLELKKDVATNTFNRLVQAKIFANKAVSQNKEVNTAVLAWADKLKIEPVTIDVEAQVS